MRSRATLSLLLTLSAGCAPSMPVPPIGEVSIRHGTSSGGICMGYCYSVMEVNGLTVTLTEEGWFQDRFPKRSRTVTLTGDEARRVHRAVDISDIASVEGVHGCPGCDDGGFEWVELLTPADSIHARSGNPNRDLAPIADLLAELRALRRRFDEEP